ncbi:pilus assembly protein PilM [Peptococcaceae bacterium 1198_IL3148]
MKLSWLFKGDSLIGVDIGLHSVKITQLKLKRGYPEIIGLASVTADINEMDTEALAVALAEVFSQINYQGQPVTATLNGEQLITRIVMVPQMSDSELQTNMFYEAAELLPNETADWVIRHTVLNNQADKQGLMQVLLIAAPRQQVLLFYQAFKMAGIKLTVIDIPYYALWRLYGNLPINPNDSVLIINLEVDHAQLVVVRQNIIQHVRSIRFSKENLINELERYLAIYQVQQSNYPIKQIILTGEISGMSDIAQVVNQGLNIKVEIGRPNLPMGEQANNKNIDLASYSIAIGSALRGVGH